jgi:hypothetical protein
LLSNKKRKLYERMKYGEKKRAGEVSATETISALCLTDLSARRLAEETQRTASSKGTELMLRVSWCSVHTY